MSTFFLYPARHSVHQDIVINCVKKLRQIQINGYFVAFFDIAFYLFNTIVS